MSFDRNWLIALLTAALAALGGVYFYQNFEKVPRRHYVGFQGEARSNAWLAAQRFLREGGLEVRPVRTLKHLDPLPGPGEVLVLPGPRASMDPALAEALLEWVGQGGHLIVTPRFGARLAMSEDALPTDPLLEQLEVRVVVEGDLEESALDKFLSADEPHAVEAELPLAENQPPLRVDLRPRGSLSYEYDDADWLLSAGERLYGLGFPWGDGRVSVLADLSFLRNDRVGELDHAALLAMLTEAEGKRVWWVLSDDMPPLPVWLAEAAPAALVSAAVLLLVWLWSSGHRFGPRLPPETTVRRSLREHLIASGRFLWRHGGGNALLDGVRRALRERIARVRPEWLRLTAPELQARLAEHSQLPLEQVRSALQDPPANPLQFTQQIQHLQALRKSL